MTSATGRRSFPLRVVRCRGCGSLVGQAFGERSPSVYCLDPVCPLVPPTNSFEERDGIILLLRRTEGLTKEQLGALVGLSRQRITQILEVGTYVPVPPPRGAGSRPRAAFR